MSQTRSRRNPAPARSLFILSAGFRSFLPSAPEASLKIHEGALAATYEEQVLLFVPEEDVTRTS